MVAFCTLNAGEVATEPGAPPTPSEPLGSPGGLGSSSVKEVLSDGAALGAGAAPKSFVHEGPTSEPHAGSFQSLDADSAMEPRSPYSKTAMMILRKSNGRPKMGSKLAVFQRHFGAAFRRSCAISLGIGVLAVVAQMVMHQGFVARFDNESMSQILAAMAGSSFLVNLLVSFRTSQSYTRYWDGCMAICRVQGEWYDACASLISFSKHSPRSAQQVDFQHVAVRLFSILFAVALSEVTDTAEDSHNLQLLDPRGIDEQTLIDLKYSGCRVDLVVAWIQGLVISNVRDGSLTCPAPILTRVFQEISSGYVALQQASILTRVPIPQEYSQICTVLVFLSSVGNAVILSTLFENSMGLFVVSFLQAFFVWSLNLVAQDLANPFGSDENDVDLPALQIEMNQRLHLLTKRKCNRTPQLVRSGRSVRNRKETLGAVLEDLDEKETEIPECSTRRSSFDSQLYVRRDLSSPSNPNTYTSAPKTCALSSDTPRDDIIVRPRLEDDFDGRSLIPHAEGRSRAPTGLQTPLDTELVPGARSTGVSEEDDLDGRCLTPRAEGRSKIAALVPGAWSTGISDQDFEVTEEGPRDWSSAAPPTPSRPLGATTPLRNLGIGLAEHDFGVASKWLASQPPALAALVADAPDPEPAEWCPASVRRRSRYAACGAALGEAGGCSLQSGAHISDERPAQSCTWEPLASPHETERQQPPLR